MNPEPRTILLVEDDAREAELTLAALIEFNSVSRVAVVSDGEQALDYLRRRGKFETRPAGNPAVVLLDLKLPKVSGLEVLKRMRADPELKTIPVIIFSSSRAESDLIEGYREGANGYVVKPLDFFAFMKAVKGLATFWAIINEPPPAFLEEQPIVHNGNLARHETSGAVK